MTQGSHKILTADVELDDITASDIEVVIGSDDSKAKGGGTVTLLFKQHDTAEWATVKTFDTADVIEDFKANSKYGGKYKLKLEGSTSPDLQVSWRI